MAREVPALAGLEWARLGDLGLAMASSDPVPAVRS